MNLLFPETPVVAPGESHLLDHTARHYFNNAERWFELVGKDITAWALGLRALANGGWNADEPDVEGLRESARGALQEASARYVEIALSQVACAVEKQQVYPSEASEGSAELRLAYVGPAGVFVVAPAVGVERPFRTAFRVCSPARVTRRKVDTTETFFENALEHAQKRTPADLARWERRARRRAQRLAPETP